MKIIIHVKLVAFNNLAFFFNSTIRYKNNMMETSRIFKERPMTAVNTAVWWTEYVLRNKEAPSYLLPLGTNQTWYQRRGLDVWAFILITMLTAFTIISLISYQVLKYSYKFWPKVPLFGSVILKDKEI